MAGSKYEMQMYTTSDEMKFRLLARHLSASTHFRFAFYNMFFQTISTEISNKIIKGETSSSVQTHESLSSLQKFSI